MPKAISMDLRRFCKEDFILSTRYSIQKQITHIQNFCWRAYLQKQNLSFLERKKTNPHPQRRYFTVLLAAYGTPKHVRVNFLFVSATHRQATKLTISILYRKPSPSPFVLFSFHWFNILLLYSFSLLIKARYTALKLWVNQIFKMGIYKP